MVPVAVRTLALFLLSALPLAAQSIGGAAKIGGASLAGGGVTLLSAGPIIYDAVPFPTASTNCSPACTIPVPASTLIGDFLAVVYSIGAAAQGTKISSVTGDGTWVSNGACLSQNSTSGSSTDISYNLSASSNGATNITTTLSASDANAQITVLRYRGGSPPYSLDGTCQVTANTNNASTTPSTPVIRTSGPFDLILAGGQPNFSFLPVTKVTNQQGSGATTPLFFSQGGGDAVEDWRSVPAATYQAQITQANGSGVISSGAYNFSALAFNGFSAVSPACTDETFIDWSGGTSGVAPTATTANNSTHGLVFPTNWSNPFGSGASLITYQSAAAIGPQAALETCTAGTTFAANESAVGVEIDYANTNVTMQMALSVPTISGNFEDSYLGYSDLYVSMWYNDNFAATDSADVDCFGITAIPSGGGADDFALVNCYGVAGTHRIFGLETKEGNGPAPITYLAATNCPCLLQLHYQSGNGVTGGTHTLTVFDKNLVQLGTTSVTGAVGPFLANQITIGNSNTLTVPAGKKIQFGTIAIKPLVQPNN